MANAKLGTKAVGSIVKLKVNGAAKEFIIVQQGKPGSMYDESCDGTWLLMKDIYENRQWHSSNVNNLENSTIHAYLNSTFLNLFDSNIKDAIKQVKIPYRKNGGSGGADQSGANGLSAKIFLLSGYEVGWTTSDNGSFPVDGAKLDYFTASSDGNSKRIANFNGSAAFWWLRSPYTSVTDYVWGISFNGYYGFAGPSDSVGIRPALILPQDMEVDSSGNITTPIGTHKTLVNGTAYEVKGGKCLVNGTVYSVKKGLALVDGTETEIKFQNGYTWVLNKNPNLSRGLNINVSFTSNGTQFSAIFSTYNEYGGYAYRLKYNRPQSTAIQAYYYIATSGQFGWTDEAYRTITFDEEPTGDLLTWLQANAVQQ